MQVSDTLPRRAVTGDETDCYGHPGGRQRRRSTVKRRTRRRERREGRAEVRAQAGEVR